MPEELSSFLREWSLLREGATVLAEPSFRHIAGPRERIWSFKMPAKYRGPTTYRARIWAFETDLPGPGGDVGDVWQRWKFGLNFDRREEDEWDAGLQIKEEVREVPADLTFASGTLKDERGSQMELRSMQDFLFAAAHGLSIETRDARGDAMTTRTYRSAEEFARGVDLSEFFGQGLLHDGPSAFMTATDLNAWRHGKLHEDFSVAVAWTENKHESQANPEAVRSRLESAFQKRGPSDEIWVRCSDGWWLYLAERGLRAEWGFWYETGVKIVPPELAVELPQQSETSGGEKSRSTSAWTKG